MSLRTYPLIVHPSYQHLVSAALFHGTSLEKAEDSSTEFSVPYLSDIKDIGPYLGISPEVVWSVRQLGHRAYRIFPVRKRSGGDRYISAPKTYLKVIQWWILDSILPAAQVSNRAYGFVKGRSFVDNARQHLGASHVLNVDLEDFFPSVSPNQVAAVYSKLGYNAGVADELARLTTLFNGLPQGAPTSPSIANAVCYELDAELDALAYRSGMRFTRYADDITMSAQQRIPGSLVNELRTVIGRHGFKLNERKTRFMGANQVKEITGVRLGRDEVCLSRSYLNSVRGWLHSNRMTMDPETIERIRGTVELVRMVGGSGSAAVVAQGDLIFARLSSN